MSRKAAVAAARRGWAVFPVLPNTKRPACDQWERRAIRLPAVVQRHWPSDRHGVGIACGPSRLVVIDLDRAKEGGPPWEWLMHGLMDGADVFAVLAERAGEARWPATFTTRTPSGGVHLYFRAPAGREIRNSAGKLGWCVDVRATGGYVLGPGSIMDGQPYGIVNDMNPLPLPGWLANLADPPSPEPPQRATRAPALLRGSAYGEAALRGELDNVLAAVKGCRNTELFKAAANLGELVAGGVLARAPVAEALVAVAREVGLGKTEARRTVASGLRAGANQPRGAAV